MLADQARQFLDLVELRRRGLRLSLTARREKSASIALRVAVSSRDGFPVLPPNHPRHRRGTACPCWSHDRPPRARRRRRAMGACVRRGAPRRSVGVPASRREPCFCARSRCASRAAAILYGKGAVFGVIPAVRRRSLRHDRIYGVLSWRTMWNARHVSGRSGILHAMITAPIPGVQMACNTDESPDEGVPRVAAAVPLTGWRPTIYRRPPGTANRTMPSYRSQSRPDWASDRAPHIRRVNLACNTLPYEIAVARDAHQVG